MAYEGPFPIVQKFSDIDYRIQFDKRKQGVVNYNKLQPYMGHSLPSWANTVMKKIKPLPVVNPTLQ